MLIERSKCFLQLVGFLIYDELRAMPGDIFLNKLRFYAKSTVHDSNIVQDENGSLGNSGGINCAIECNAEM